MRTFNVAINDDEFEILRSALTYYIYKVSPLGIKDSDLLKKLENIFLYPSRLEHQLKIGDVVRLNSGGPVMTIVGFDGNNIHLLGFNNNEKIEFYAFEQCLIKMMGGEL